MIDAQLERAAAASRAAVASGIADAHDHMILGLASAARDDHAAAAHSFDRAVALEPNNPAVLTGLASWYRQQGRLRDAALACDAAIRIAPDYADAWLERGAVMGAGGSSRASRESFATAARLQPGSARAHAGLAGQAARDGDMDAARRAAETALSLDAGNLAAAAALAQALLHDGDAAAARELLAPMVAAAGVGHARSVAAHALGRAQERVGNSDAAFAAYQLSKDDFRAINLAGSAKELGHTQFVEAIIAGVEAVPPEAWRKRADVPAQAQPPHIFLAGYPRSGTTLVENILASLPGVSALEEWPTFAAADARFLAGDARAVATAIADIARLDSTERADLRAAYWARVADGGVDGRAGPFVDMDPLKATRLPLINALFPDARILVMRRDPRDVVWSCFKTSFALTSNTLEYTSIERAARHYDALMRLTDLCLDRLPVCAMDVRYRDLIRDFDGVTNAICRFAGLEWSDAVRRFDSTAHKRGVGTASAAQVRKGLYDGSGQWRPFARYLEPVLPILEPWIERFGDE